MIEGFVEDRHPDGVAFGVGVKIVGGEKSMVFGEDRPGFVGNVSPGEFSSLDYLCEDAVDACGLTAGEPAQGLGKAWDRAELWAAGYNYFHVRVSLDKSRDDCV